MKLILLLVVATIVKQSYIAEHARKEGEQIFEDVEGSVRGKRQVLKNYKIPETTWKNGIFYAFNTTDNLVYTAFRKGEKLWSDVTCIDFIENRNAQDKVVIIKENGCWSKIGQVGGDQLLSLSDDCGEGSAAHEIGHVLGLTHTISRYDRDNYVTIAEENVDPKLIDDFSKFNKSYADVYGLKYDYGSVMHYGEKSGSTNNQLTIIAKDSYYQKTMGSEMMSFIDIFTVNEHHGCNEKCNKATSAKCANEGFPHPRNCSVCICPSGYGGTLCDRRPSGCGEDLVATTEKKVVNCKIGGYKLTGRLDFCHYMITAPKGKKIEVEVRSISNGYDLSGCIKGGVEIKAQTDPKLTGYRFCSMKGSEFPIISSMNPLPVIVFNKFLALHTTFTYRYIN